MHLTLYDYGAHASTYSIHTPTMSLSNPSPPASKLSPSDIPQPLRSLATSTLTDPQFRAVSMSRTVTDSGRGHTLMGRTWNTPTTIPALLSFYRHSTTSSPSSNDDTIDLSHTTRAEVRRFYHFGPDMNAHPDLLHGGVISCILDSSLGGAVGIVAGRKVREGEAGVSLYTVQLNVKYVRPVKTPGAVMVRSWVTKVEGGGRKMWAKGRVEGDGGVVFAEGEGLWVRGRAKI